MLLNARSPAIVLFVLFCFEPAKADTVNTTMSVGATILPRGCTINNTPSLNFPNTTALVNEDEETDISVTCSNGAAYSIAIDGGGWGTTSSDRKLQSNITYSVFGMSTYKYVTYQLFRDEARTLPWGWSGTETLSSTGTGQAKTHRIYARIPAQTAANEYDGDYKDSVTITVIY
jgi:spore coat protein U-like protein